MQIVRGDVSRVDEVGPLFQAMHEHHRSCGEQLLPFRPDEDAWARRRPYYVSLLESGRGHLLLAEDGGRVIGYAMVSETRGQATLVTADRMAELETLSVADGARGRGVGSALMEAAYAVMRQLGIDEVMLYVLDGNERAMRFYERRGMKPYLHVMLGRVPAADAAGRTPRTPGQGHPGSGA
jgi:ribosomal protein S18 acetylase RimI-like enzyme